MKDVEALALRWKGRSFFYAFVLRSAVKQTFSSCAKPFIRIAALSSHVCPQELSSNGYLGKDAGFPTYDELLRLPYLDAVFKETLRL